MWDRLERVTAPTLEPVTLQEAKDQCRIDTDDYDALLTRLITVARSKIEGRDGIGILFSAQTWKLSLDRMPVEIWIPIGPVLSIDSIVYVDEGGTSRTLASSGYQWRKDLFGARIKPPYSGTFPTVRQQYDAVQVTFTAGFPGTEDSPPTRENIPEALRHAILMLVEHYFDHRDAIVPEAVKELPFGVASILDQYRVGLL